MSTATECHKLIEALPTTIGSLGLPGLVDQLEQERAEIARQMAALKRAGLIYATLHTRANKYLYLIYPMQGGERRREYVGSDPDKIEAAKAAVERAKQYDALDAELQRLEGRLSAVRGHLQEVMTLLRRKW